MRRVIVALLLLGALACPAYAETLRIKTPGTLTTQGGSRVELAPGTVIVPPADVARIDAEVRALQETATRLEAENATLRDLTEDDPVRTLKIAGLGLLLGAAIGFVAGWAL